MVSMLVQSEHSVFEPRQGHCVVFSGKTLYSYSAPLHPGVQMVLANFMLGVTL